MTKQQIYEAMDCSTKDVFGAHIWYLLGFASGQVVDTGGFAPLCSCCMMPHSDSCTFCPIREYTKLDICGGTPYDDIDFSLVETKKQAVKAANLLEFFADFLPTNHQLLPTVRRVIAAIKTNT